MNQLYYSGNLYVLRAHIAAESVDLIYLDPPFNSRRDHNLLFKARIGRMIKGLACILICYGVGFGFAIAQINPASGVAVPRPQQNETQSSASSSTAALWRAKGYDWQDFHLELISRSLKPEDRIGDIITVQLGLPSNTAGIPSDMRHPWFGAIKVGPSKSPVVIPIAAENAMDTPRVFMLDKATGRWTMILQTKTEPPTQVCPLYDSSGVTNLTIHTPYGSQNLPLEIQLSFQRLTKGDGTSLSMNFVYRLCSMRSGAIELNGKKFNVLLASKSGDFNDNAVLFIDRNGDGNFDFDQEGYFLNRAFNIDGKNYVTQVSDATGAILRVGKTDTVAPLNEPAMKVTHFKLINGKMVAQ